MIQQSTNDIFTNDSCGDVETIAESILSVKTEIQNIDGLRVISGYHGTSDGTTSTAGNYSHDFNQEDLTQMISFIQKNFSQMQSLVIVLYMESEILLQFAKDLAEGKSFTLECHQSKGMPDDSIQTYFTQGKAFFTWCYSHDKLKRLGLIT